MAGREVREYTNLTYPKDKKGPERVRNGLTTKKSPSSAWLPRQQDLLKRVVEVKPRRQRHYSSTQENVLSVSSSGQVSDNCKSDTNKVQEKQVSPTGLTKASYESKVDNPVKSLLLAYGQF